MKKVEKLVGKSFTLEGLRKELHKKFLEEHGASK